MAGLLPGLSGAGNRECLQPLPNPVFPGDGHAGRRSGGRNEIKEWVEAARVAHTMEHNRLGVMGHYYGGMLDIYSDLTQQCAYFGGHIEVVEVDELAALRRQVSRR